MKKNLDQIIKEKTIPLNDFFKDFTPEQNKRVDALTRYYSVLFELKFLRKKLGLTQQKLAQKAALPRSTISKIECGDYNPTLQTLMSIAAAMGKTIRLQLL